MSVDILRAIPAIGGAMDEYEAMRDLQCPVDSAGEEMCCWHIYISSRCQMAQCCHCGVKRPCIGVHRYQEGKEHGPRRPQELDEGVVRIQT